MKLFDDIQKLDDVFINNYKDGLYLVDHIMLIL